MVNSFLRQDATLAAIAVGDLPAAVVSGVGPGLLESSSIASIDPSFMQGFLSGLQCSATTTTSLSVTSGVCVDSTNSVFIKVGAFTKATGNGWVAGSGNNGANVAVGASSTYHYFAIINGGVSDQYIDSDPAAANKPAGTTAFRRLFSFKTDASSHVIPITQNGDEFLLMTPVIDINWSGSASNLGTSAVTFTLGSVPTGVKVNAIGLVILDSGLVSATILLSSLDTTDTAPTASPGTSGGLGVANPNFYIGYQANVRTNTSAQIRARSSTAGAFLAWTTQGWIDTRGKF